MIEIIRTYNTTTKELLAFINALPDREREKAMKAAAAMGKLREGDYE